MISKKKQAELDYWVIIETAARDGELPDHDCHDSPNDSCVVCIDYRSSRNWWLRQKRLEQNNAKNKSGNNNSNR